MTLVKFTVDGEDYYVTPDVAEDYRRKFEEQSERFADVLERAEVEIAPIRATENAAAKLDEFLADIEREGLREQKRFG